MAGLEATNWKLQEVAEGHSGTACATACLGVLRAGEGCKEVTGAQAAPWEQEEGELQIARAQGQGLDARPQRTILLCDRGASEGSSCLLPSWSCTSLGEPPPYGRGGRRRASGSCAPCSRDACERLASAFIYFRPMRPYLDSRLPGSAISNQNTSRYVVFADLPEDAFQEGSGLH